MGLSKLIAAVLQGMGWKSRVRRSSEPIGIVVEVRRGKKTEYVQTSSYGHGRRLLLSWALEETDARLLAGCYDYVEFDRSDVKDPLPAAFTASDLKRDPHCIVDRSVLLANSALTRRVKPRALWRVVIAQGRTLPTTRVRHAIERFHLLRNRRGAIEIAWRKGDPAAGFTDVLPLWWFAATGTTKRRTHLVRGAGGKEYTALCKVTVKERVADLDYAAFSDENERRGMCLGVLRITFADSSRLCVDPRNEKSVMWSVEAGRFEPGKAKVAVVPRSAGHAPPVSEPTTPKRIEREIVLRPQQARFRAGLLERYNGACCLSGCTAQDALDAAHIYPYSAKHLDHVSNGLLLRRDLHGLFDAGKLAFDPKTLEACFAPDVRDCYRALHGKRMSLPDDPEARPAPQALAARWALYQRDSG